MPREELPEYRQDAFVGKKHLPDRLDPLCERVIFQQLGCEGVSQQPLPGVEFEDAANRIVVEIDEAKLIQVPTDVVDAY